MRHALRNGFAQLYSKNDRVHELEKKEVLAIVVEITGLLATHPTARAIVGTFFVIAAAANLRIPQVAGAQAAKSGKGAKLAEQAPAAYFVHGIITPS
jgi:hypothetical protein